MEYCSQSRNSNVWLLQRASQCSVQMDQFKFPKVSVCAQNTSGLNFCVFCGSSSHAQILSSMNIWAKVLHNCCKNGRRMRCTLTCSTVDFVACLGTNMHQFSIRLPNTPNATNNILFYCCLCVASWYTYDCALLRISLAFRHTSQVTYASPANYKEFCCIFQWIATQWTVYHPCHMCRTWVLLPRIEVLLSPA